MQLNRYPAIAKGVALLSPVVMLCVLRYSTKPMGFGDSASYMKMAEHTFQLTSSPHGYRILVPYAAALISKLTSLPLPTSFFVLSALCFITINAAIILWSSQLLQHSMLTAVLLSALYAFSFAGVYNLHNFVHVEFFEQLLVLLGCIAIYHGKFLWLILIVAVGSFVKENVALLIPLYGVYALQEQRLVTVLKSTALLLGAFAAGFVFLRSGIVFQNGANISSYTTFYTLDYVKYVYNYWGGYTGAAKAILLTFPVLWALAAMGFICPCSTKPARTMAVLVPLAILQIVLATDVLRMTAICFPALLLLVGNLFRIMTTTEKVLMTSLSAFMFYCYNYYLYYVDLPYRNAGLLVALLICYAVIACWYAAVLRKRIRNIGKGFAPAYA